MSDDSGRIAMLEKRTIGTDDAKEVLTRYVYSNHLQSASLELDGIGDIISYEEYHPYGTTAFQAKNASINAIAKRYRYTGKERDEESGLYYHGARYYIPWLCRWTAIDPMESKYAGMSPYNYSFNNPIMWNDLNGADPGVGDDDKLTGSATPVLKNEVLERQNEDGSWSGDALVTGLDTFSVIGNKPATGIVDDELHSFNKSQEANYRTQEMKEIFAYRDKFGVFPRTNFTYTPTYLGEDEFGFFHGTQKTLDYRIFQKQKELGETLRNGGPFTSIGYSVGGLRGMQWAMILDAGIMFAAGNAGAPYGKLGPNKPISTKSLANTSMPQYPGLISSKFPSDPIPTEGRSIPFEIINGNIKGVNGQRNFDFVINKQSELLIGNKHHFLGNAQAVLAAGQLRLNGQGQIRTIDNQSGHYQPTISETSNFGKLFESTGLGLNLKGATVETYTFSINNNNFILGRARIFSRTELKHK